MNFTAEQLVGIAKMVEKATSKPAKKAKGKKNASRTKLSDEQKALNATANAQIAEKLFADAGFKNNVAHETIRTYDKWVEVGRRVMKGQKSLRTPKGVALFHLSQTSDIVSDGKMERQAKSGVEAQQTAH